MAGYQIFTDATADCGTKLAEAPASVRVIPMQLEIGGQEYTYGPGGTITTEEFYALQRAGNYATTTQIGPSVYFQFFEEALRAGQNVLYLCFTSGMSGTFQSAQVCADALAEAYPDRKIICVDTLCASVGEGFLVWEAARRQAAGYSLEELAQWVTESRLKVCHWFTVDVFDHLRRGGRVSAAAAVLGTALQIKPLLHVDEAGRLAVVEKPRGRKQAIKAQLARMEQGWMPELGSTVMVGHGDCAEGAHMLEEAIRAQFPTADIVTADIGPIIGAHTGPGMLAVIYWGSTR